MEQTYSLPQNIDETALRGALAAAGLRPSGYVMGAGDFAPPTALAFDPPLAPEQKAQVQAIYTRIQSAQTDYAQVEQLRTDLLGYRDSAEAYLALTSPTNAQSVAAIKALIRICGIIIRLLFILIDFVTQKAVQGFR